MRFTSLLDAFPAELPVGEVAAARYERPALVELEVDLDRTSDAFVDAMNLLERCRHSPSAN